MAANDAPHSAADVIDELLSRRAGGRDAKHGLHAGERLAGSDPGARIVSQPHTTAVADRPARRMRQAHEELAVEIDGKPLLAVGGFRVGAISAQPDVQQPMRLAVEVFHFDEFSQDRRILFPAIRDVNRRGEILGLQLESGFAAAGFLRDALRDDFQLGRNRRRADLEILLELSGPDLPHRLRTAARRIQFFQPRQASHAAAQLQGDQILAAVDHVIVRLAPGAQIDHQRLAPPAGSAAHADLDDR